MRDFIFRLDGERCVDGVERVRLDNSPDVKSLSAGKAHPVWFFWRSDRHERVVREADLGDPLVTRFLNANNDDRRIEFLSAYGLPEGFLLGVSGSKKEAPVSRWVSADLPKGWVLGAPGVGLPAEPRNFVQTTQRRLRRLLEDAASGNAARKDKAAKQALRFIRDSNPSVVNGRVALTAPTLIAFMAFEVYMAAENGAYVASCKRCGDLFLYGKGTKRRNTATYCSNRCRVGAHRANKRKGD